MVIAVTGAAGRVGEFVAADLISHGHEVIAVDLEQTASTAAVYRRADVTDRSSLVSAFEGCEAIIHLAAIAEAGIAPPEVTFQINALGTFNCLEAAVESGVGRFVYASSEAVLGFAYREREFMPEYFPIDEAHPLQPQDCYGVSKVAAEEACRAYSRSGALSTVCVRPSYCWGMSLGDEATQSIRDPELHYRSLWVYIHLEDIAKTYRLACEKPDLEHETFYAVAPDIRSNVPTADLIERFYPGVPIRRDLGEYGSLIANDRAQEVLGFEPTRSWRDDVPRDSIPMSLGPA